MELSRHAPVYLILPGKPTLREQFAADELSRYLFLVLGVKAEKADSAIPGANSFLIGGPGRNAASAAFLTKEEFHGALTGAEGIFLEIRDNIALIAGSEGFDDCERGTVYAVYEFLERYLGCSFAAYSGPGVHAGEVLPVLDWIALPNGRYVKALSLIHISIGRPIRWRTL